MVTKPIEASPSVIPAIGETAGRIWRALDGVGQVRLSTLPRRVEASSTLVHLALGWLAREDKVEITGEGRGHLVKLR